MHVNVLKLPPFPADLVNEAQENFDRMLSNLNERLAGKKTIMDFGLTIVDIFVVEFFYNAFAMF